MINYSKLDKNRKKELAYLPESKKENVTCISEQQNWGLELLSVPSVWHFTKGAGIKVAVLDTGVEQDHPDLEPNIKEAVDFTSSAHGSTRHRWTRHTCGGYHCCQGKWIWSGRRGS